MSWISDLGTGDTMYALRSTAERHVRGIMADIAPAAWPCSILDFLDSWVLGTALDRRQKTGMRAAASWQHQHALRCTLHSTGRGCKFGLARCATAKRFWGAGRGPGRDSSALGPLALYRQECFRIARWQMPTDIVALLILPPPPAICEPGIEPAVGNADCSMGISSGLVAVHAVFAAQRGGLYVAVLISFNFGCLKCQPQLHPVSLSPCRETKGCAPTSHV
jgi:hypothetical protein